MTPLSQNHQKPLPGAFYPCLSPDEYSAECWLGTSVDELSAASNQHPDENKEGIVESPINLAATQREAELKAYLTNAVHTTTPPATPDWTVRLREQLVASIETLLSAKSCPEWGSIEDAVERFGLSRSTFYTLMDLGFIRSTTARTKHENVSGRRLLYFPSIRAYLNRCADQQFSADDGRSTKVGGAK